MKIILVRPRPHKQTINLQSFMICEPLELEILAAALEKAGHTTEIADLIVERRGLRRFLKGADMVCFTAYLVHAGAVKKYAALVKRYNPAIITVAGGVHAEVVPQDFICPEMDYVVFREPVKTLLEIAAGKSGAGELSGVYVAGREGAPVSLDVNPPLPNRSKTERYRKKYNYVLHSRCATLKTSFGCNYDCSFCFCREITGGKYACRSMDAVFEELKTIKEHNVFIVDDNFLTSAQKAENFCKGLDEHGLSKSFILFGRADFIAANEPAIKNLAAHGLKSVFVGIESFNPDELKDMNKRTTADMNYKAIKVLEDCGVESYMGIICRHDWKKEDFDSLLGFLEKVKYPFINLQPILPVPGTALYEREKANIELERERYHLWDMAHLCVSPTNMSVKEFYGNMLRVYLKTAAAKRMRVYIRRTYGMRVYLRALKGAASIWLQYKALMRKNKINV